MLFWFGQLWSLKHNDTKTICLTTPKACTCQDEAAALQQRPRCACIDMSTRATQCRDTYRILVAYKRHAWWGVQGYLLQLAAAIVTIRLLGMSSPAINF